METFSALLALCAHKAQWRGALMFSLIRAWMEHRLTHYDVNVMKIPLQTHLIDGYQAYFLGNCSRVNAMESMDDKSTFPDSKVHGANMGPIWGRQDPGGPNVGPMNFAIWVASGNGFLASDKPLPERMLSLCRQMESLGHNKWKATMIILTKCLLNFIHYGVMGPLPKPMMT